MSGRAVTDNAMSIDNNALNRLDGGDRDGSPEENDDGPDLADSVRNILEVVTQETRFTLVQNILAHPKGAPSLKELDYVNPSKSKSTVRDHLEKLGDAGVIETVELPEDARKRDLPWKFYRLTEEGRGFLEEHDLVRAEDTLQEMHEMLEKTDEIEKYETAPRPDDVETSDEDTTVAAY